MKTLMYFVLAVCCSSIGLGADAKSPDELNIRLDGGDPYLILATEKARADYSKAIELAKELHPAAAEDTFAIDDFDCAKRKEILVLLVKNR